MITHETAWSLIKCIHEMPWSIIVSENCFQCISYFPNFLPNVKSDYLDAGWCGCCMGLPCTTATGGVDCGDDRREDAAGPNVEGAAPCRPAACWPAPCWLGRIFSRLASSADMIRRPGLLAWRAAEINRWNDIYFYYVKHNLSRPTAFETEGHAICKFWKIRAIGISFFNNVFKVTYLR